VTSGPHWFPAYIGLGSNLDEPPRQIQAAFELLAALPKTVVVKRSSNYRSAPFGGVEQPDFVNAVAALLTQLLPQELLRELLGIEKKRGRVRGECWGPRTLDLDLLVYSSQCIDEADLKVPHPGIAERNFVLLPLMEVAPDLVIPGLGRVQNLDVDTDAASISRIG
jgi:2-amino-4-hydroxy-6-hydroxymethyldihydropteridine diphosphokinase